MYVRRRAQASVAHVMRAYDSMTKQLSEAERIGHFGSFLWDFKDQSDSYWSDEMYELFGLVRRSKPPGPEIIVSSAHKDDADRIKGEWDKAHVEPGPFSFDFRAVSPTGQVRHVRVQGKTLMGAKIRPLRIQGVVHDITKEMEIDKAKSEFVSLASHQLKTPLTSIKWLSEVLLTKGGEPLTPTQTTYINNIHASSMHMVDIVNDLLNVSRIELGTLALRIEEFDVASLVADVTSEQSHVAEEKHVMMKVTCEEGLPHLKADRNLVRMVFQNLISNAIKYTLAGGSVVCEVSRASGARETLFIRVTDTGIGIPEKAKDKIFTKLYRAGNASASVPDGTGLGLYVVKTVVERAHGGVTFESTEGKGTTFYASFPFEWEVGVEKK